MALEEHREVKNNLSKEGIGKEIKRQRRLHGERIGSNYTQKNLCDDFRSYFDVSLDVNSLSRMERGQQEPSLSQAIQMSLIMCQERDWKSTLIDIASAGIRNDLAYMDGLSAGMELLGSLSNYYDEHLKLIVLLVDLITAARDEGWLSAQSEDDRAFLDEAGVINHDRGVTEILNEIFTVMDTRKPVVTESMAHRLSSNPSIVERINAALATPAPPQGAVAIDEPQGKEHDHEQD